MAATVSFLLWIGIASGQTAQTDNSNPPAEQQASSEQDAQRSAIEVKPGQPAIKQKDIWNETGYLHPFVRMPRYILQDQKAIWTSPLHTAKQDVKFWVIFGGATAALVATDRHSVTVLPNSSSQISVSTWGSRFGSAYTLIPASAAFYLVGTPLHDQRFRETGLLCFEALIDSNLVAEAVKLAADRARPLENGGAGHFEDSPNGRWNSSFPSGHAINTWTMASVIAHQYPHPRIVPILAYALAGTVVVSRVGARQHFPGDVMAGSAMGWFIGDYVYGKRHNRELDHKPTAAEKILDHVHFGLEM
ncbi:MAG TPA: phosphatase PAP2 family protein [Bryobacteraceae bacterium]|nr:phosphatase PAP2 family protein [Bryobacteraceae bacterium]